MNKLLLYCTKAKPYLEFKQIPRTLMDIDNSFEGYRCSWKRTEDDENFQLNGKIVAECDFEVEEITNCGTSFMIMKYDDLQDNYRYTNEIARGSCLDYNDLKRYLGTDNGYAIHIKNLHIFDEPRELSDYYKFDGIYNNINNWKPIDKAPQNMMYAYDITSELGFSGTYNRHFEEDILISIQPQWLCKILNGEKTIEVRKKVLKEMLENGL